MSKFEGTPCIRCGKIRVFSKTWKEKPDNRGNVLTYTETVCPDKDCQKVVSDMFAEKKQKREDMENRRKGLKLKPQVVEVPKITA